jgi:hypothetical protein
MKNIKTKFKKKGKWLLKGFVVMFMKEYGPVPYTFNAATLIAYVVFGVRS